MQDHDDFLDLSVIEETANEDSLPPRKIKLGPGPDDFIVFHDPIETLDVMEAKNVIRFLMDLEVLAVKMASIKPTAPKKRRVELQNEYTFTFLDRYDIEDILEAIQDWAGVEAAQKLQERGLKLPELMNLLMDLNRYFGEKVKN